MIPTRARIARCSAATRSWYGGRAQPNVRWSSPARRQGSPGTEVVGALPAVLRPEDRAELLQPPVQRTQPPRPSCLRDVVRIALPVVVLVDLARARCGEIGIPVGTAEAPRAVGLDVDLGARRRHELRERLAEPARATESVQGQACSHPEAADARHRPEQRIAVRCHCVRMAHERRDACPVEEREATGRPLHQLLKACVIRWQHPRAVLPRHAVVPPRDRVRLVAAEQDAAALRLAVDEVVGVAEAGRVTCELPPFDRMQRNVLVVDGDRACERADHCCDLRRPHARGVDDDVRLDATAFGKHRPNLASRTQLDSGDPCVDADVGSELARGCGDGIGRDVRVDVPVTGHPHSSEEGLRAGRGHQSPHVVRTDELGVETDAVRAADAATQLAQALRARCDPQRADGLEDPELLVEIDAVAPEAHHRRRRIELGHEPGSVVRRAARQLALLEQDDVPHPSLCEVVGTARARDAAPDDDRTHAGTADARWLPRLVWAPVARAVAAVSPARRSVLTPDVLEQLPELRALELCNCPVVLLHRPAPEVEVDLGDPVLDRAP